MTVLLAAFAPSLFASPQDLWIAVAGDVPYTRPIEERFHEDLEKLARRSPKPSLFVHVGDIADAPCPAPGGRVAPCDPPVTQGCFDDGAWVAMATAMRRLADAGVPAVVLPGDNETVDCAATPGGAWKRWEKHLGPLMDAMGGERAGHNVTFAKSGVLIVGLSLPKPPEGEDREALTHLRRSIHDAGKSARAVIIMAHSLVSILSDLPGIVRGISAPVLLVQGDKHDLAWIPCPCLVNAAGEPARLLVVAGDDQYCGVALLRFDAARKAFELERGAACAAPAEGCHLCN